MGDKEFKRLFDLQVRLRDALRQVQRARRKYPAGIEMLLSAEQYEKMKKIEEEVTELST